MMKKILKIVLISLTFGFYSCNQAQNQNSVNKALRSCFEQNFFTHPEAYTEFEQLLINNKLISNTDGASFQVFFLEFFPYNSFKQEESYYHKKRLLATILNQQFHNLDNLEQCLVKLEKPALNDHPDLYHFMEAIQNIYNTIDSDKTPESWENLRVSEVLIKKTKDHWFENTDVKYLSLYNIYTEVANYTDEEMEKEIEQSKLVYGERKENKNSSDKKIELEVIISDETDLNDFEGAETIAYTDDDELPSTTDEIIEKLERKNTLNEQAIKVDLSKLNLNKIPDSIWKKTDVNYLIVSENKLKSIPDKIANFKELKVLDLDNNDLSQIPNSIGELNALSHLYVSGNKLTSLPNSIKNLEKLKVLHIENNLLNEVEKRKIQKLLPTRCKIYF